MDVDASNEDFPPPDNEQIHSDDEPAPLPSRFIFVKHHPHSGIPDKIIPLDATEPSETPNIFADYRFASRCVKRRMTNKEINEDLDSLHNGVYSSDCKVSFYTHRDVEKSLAAARITNVSFHSETLVIDFDGPTLGKRYEVQVEFRDPWELMKRWACDESLVGVSTWHSQRKYLCMDGAIDLANPLYDEPWTGETWWEVDDDLPNLPNMQSCFLGLHVWLDKGQVSTKVKMHPILFRACWIESATRNGSGNGGGTLAGFVRKPEELRQVDPKSLSGNRRTEYDQLKRSIYHGVCRLVLESLRRRSHCGEAFRFGDGVIRMGYPGILIESMDFEEVAAWLAIRNSRSLHPCPHCLVHRDDLHDLSLESESRTTESMVEALRQALQCDSRTAREDKLKQFGLHNFAHFLWKFAHSELYKAVGYDCLHYFDSGIWGRHIWALFKEYLQEHGLSSAFNEYMDQFPRWRNLKHLSAATKIDYSEAQTFVDILKCISPCISELLPRNSLLVRVARVMQKIRVMLGLDVTTRSRLDHLRTLILEYNNLCNDISKDLGKSFDFLKQHFLSHAAENIQQKGTSRNMNTRVGEGFQQEVSALYCKTNGKNAEHQISVLDENEETMARLDMEVQLWKDSQALESEFEPIPAAVPNQNTHWKLGSAEKRIHPRRFELLHRGEALYRNFEMRLREYLASYHPNTPVHLEEDIEILPCKALAVTYQSRVNWKSERDILRCNPNFHKRPRYDSLIFSAEDDQSALGQLALLFRCFLPRGTTLDLALVRTYRNSSFKSKTPTDCPVREKNSSSMFIALEHVERGALLCPIFGASKEVFYVIDCIDEDMYLRVNDLL
ncbi:hypothetical protein R3P38DRAFT_3331734 [Favolaschia claudopus]|uniref:Uncharacterized protein n=1 Tax=Favolaschia claudopus TaxID=2862362 RepID=A0AAV9ZRK3_9AGAR